MYSTHGESEDQPTDGNSTLHSAAEETTWQQSIPVNKEGQQEFDGGKEAMTTENMTNNHEE